MKGCAAYEFHFPRATVWQNKEDEGQFPDCRDAFVQTFNNMLTTCELPVQAWAPEMFEACEQLGCESIDGTGWFKDPSRQDKLPAVQRFIEGHRNTTPMLV